MAGKPEQHIAHPAPLNRIVYQNHQKLHIPSISSATVATSVSPPSSLQINQDPLQSQYDQIDKFNYDTSIGRNDETVTTCENFQEQRLSVGVHQHVVSPTAIFPVSKTCYNIEGTVKSTSATSPLVLSSGTVETQDIEDNTDVKYDLVDCCRTIAKSHIVVSDNGVGERQRNVTVEVGKFKEEGEIISSNEIGSARLPLGNSYRNSSGPQGSTTGFEGALQQRVSDTGEIFSRSESPSQSDRDSLSGKSDEDLSTSTVTTWKSSGRTGNAGVAVQQGNNERDLKDLGNVACMPSVQSCKPSDNLAYSDAITIPSDCSYAIGADSITLVSTASIGTIVNARSSSSSGSDSSTASGFKGHRRVTYSRRIGQNLDNCKIDRIAKIGNDDDSLERRSLERNNATPDRRCCSASLDIVESSCISNSSNSSGSSSSGSTSGRSSASILDSPECQVRDRVAVSVFGEQATSSMSQVIGHQNSNVSLNVDDNVAANHRHRRQQQQSQHPTSISEPRGWKRISTNNVIIYISPSSTALGSLGQLKEYLTTPGTCKCGLECPLRPERAFNFDPKVATRPWSPVQGKTREMNKLCNHKRKLLSTTGAASPVASCTPNVSSTGAPTSIRTIHGDADSPISSDFIEQFRKDGSSKKKKRKLAGVSSNPCDVSGSQLIIHRNKPIAIDPSAPRPLQPSMIKNSQGWSGGMGNSQFEQINQQMNHQSVNSRNASMCGLGNTQQRLHPQNMGSMLVGNTLTINQQGTNVDSMSNQQSVQHQMQMLHRQPDQLQQQNIVTNQLSQQHYGGPLHQQMQPQPHINQQQINVQHNIQKHNMEQQHVVMQETIRQHHPQLLQQQQQQQQRHNNNINNSNNESYVIQHLDGSFVHHMQTSQTSPEMCPQQQLNQVQHSVQHHQMQPSLRQQQHVIQNEGHENYQMQISRQQHAGELYDSQQYPNQTINNRNMEIIMNQGNGSPRIVNDVDHRGDIQEKYVRVQSIGDGDDNSKDILEHQIMLHNQTSMQCNKIVQNGNAVNNGCESLQRIYQQDQFVSGTKDNCAERTKSSVATKIEPKMMMHQQFGIVGHVGRGANDSREADNDVQTDQNSRATGMWQHHKQHKQQIVRNNVGAVYQNEMQNQSLSTPDVACNSLDRVPPLHQHIPPVFAWTEEVARKKPKPGKAINKKQRQHHSLGETRNSIAIEQSNRNMRDKFDEAKIQVDNQIGSTVKNNGNSPSFLEDPSGYLAQQTALLNSTISRQTSVTSSQIRNDTIKLNNRIETPENISNPVAGIENSEVGIYMQQQKTSTKSNAATCPILVHSSVIGDKPENPSSYNKQSGYKLDIQSSYIQDQYSHEDDRATYQLRADQREDPVTSSTFAERFPLSSSGQPPIDPRPIQGGTVSTSHGSPVGSSSSPANFESSPNSNWAITQAETPRNPSEVSTTQSYSQPGTPYAYCTSTPTLSNLNHHSLAPMNFEGSKTLVSHQDQQQQHHNRRQSQHQSISTNSNRYPTTTSVSSSISPSPSPSQTFVSPLPSENVPSHLSQRSSNNASHAKIDINQQITSDMTINERVPLMERNSSVTTAVVTTMASGHTFSSNTITSVLAGRANTATVSINTPSTLVNRKNISKMCGHGKVSGRQQHESTGNYSTGILLPSTTSVTMIVSNSGENTNVSKSPLEMVQSVVSSIQVPQTSAAMTVQHNQQQHMHQQSNIQVHNVLASSGGSILKQTTSTASAAAVAAAAAASFPPGHILVSSGGQLIMASTGGSGISGVMPPPPAPTKIMSSGNGMPPLSVSPMVTNVSAAVNQVIPPVGVGQQMIGQPTVLVNTIQTPVLIQPGVMTMDGIGQNVQIPHLAMATGNVLQNSQSLIDANQEVNRNLSGTNQGMTNGRQTGLLSNESGMSNKRKVYKKRKNNCQTVSPMVHYASSQQNAGVLVQSQSNFAQQNFQSPGLGGQMLQALTIVPGKGGGPAQLVMNSQTGGTQATQFNTQQIITNSQPSQQINLLQPVNLLSGTTGMVQNFPTIQQFIVPGLGSMVMSADGTTTLLQDTANLGMQLQIQNVNGQNVLTPVQSHSGLFSPGQGILATGPAGMVIRAPQATGGKIIHQHATGAQFLSPNNGQFLVNGSTSFGNQLSPIVASVNPNQQVTFNTSQVRPSQGLQAQQEFIQMNGQTLMVPCATSHNIAVSSAANQQNTTFVQQNTTIVQQQTTMVSNSQISDFQTAPSSVNNGNRLDRSSINLDHSHSYIMNSGMINKAKISSKAGPVHSPFLDHRQRAVDSQNQRHKSMNNQEQSNRQQQQQQQYLLSSTSNVGRGGNNNNHRGGMIVNDKCQGESNDGRFSPSMVRHSVSTQTAGANNQANQGNIMRQGESPPDTTTHSPGNSQRSNSPAVDTTTHGAASPAPTVTSHHHSSSTPMVHCISSSEPDSADVQAIIEEWKIEGTTRTKEITPGRPIQLDGKTYVESTVTTGIQIYASETSKQADGVMSTMRCEGRGIKRKLDSIHNMHSILHEDQDVSEDEEDCANNWKLEVGQLVWGAALGSTAWPGKVESVGPPGSLTVGVRWYGAGSASGLTHVQIKSLKSLSEGLEAHHRARKRVRKSRKLNMQLENAIQEAMTELDRYSEKESSRRALLSKTNKIQKKASSRIGKSSPSSSTSTFKNRGSSSMSRDTKKFVTTESPAKTLKKPYR